MNKKGFSLIEVCLALFCISILTSTCVFSIRFLKKSHRINTFVQELTLLRNAFVTYKEIYGTLPSISRNKLSDKSFEAIQPYWHPFNPDNSNLGGTWLGESSNNLDDVYLMWTNDPTAESTSPVTSIDFDVVFQKINQMFEVDSEGKCYIFKTPSIAD